MTLGMMISLRPQQTCADRKCSRGRCRPRMRAMVVSRAAPRHESKGAGAGTADPKVRSARLLRPSDKTADPIFYSAG